MNEQLTDKQIIDDAVDNSTTLQPTAVSDDYKGFLNTLLQSCEREDDAVHLANVRKAKRLEYLFNNIVDLFWDGSDWVVPDWDEKEESGISPRIINIYRPHAESIIAALTVNVPSVLFFPKDSDNADDIDTADNYSNLSKLIQKHNKAQLLFIKIICILFNQGTVFVYSYFKSDRSFGYYQVEETTVEKETLHNHDCPICGLDFGDGPDQPQQVSCPDCKNDINTEVTPVETEKSVPVQVNKERGRVLIDPFGVTSVKVPYSARSQDHCGYLILKFDQSVAMLRSMFCIKGPNGEKPLIEKIEPSITDVSIDSNNRYPSIYLGNTPQNTAIVKCVWYRPWQLMLLTESNYETLAQELQQKYPNGLYVIYINDEAVEIHDEYMDDHWTISYDPRAQALHGEPLGTNLAMIQDISAEINELELQTMEHGISEVFVASDALDWKNYGDTQAKPGNITPVFKEPGKAISENFYETKTATLSPEIGAMNAKYNNLAEFVTGDFPTVYGGSTPGSSTATEYTKSQSQALQRLGTVWKICSFLWADIMHKATREYAQKLDYEESFVEKGNNGFNTTKIDPEGMEGEIGRCEPETSESLPVSQSQIKDLLMNLLATKDPMIMNLLSHPQNNELVKKAIGITELYIPGINDRTKQYREISQLLQGEPLENKMNPFGFEPSIMPEEFDDHAVEMEICKIWLNSSKGQKAKYDNPMGYQNVIAHWKAHQMMQMIRTEVPNEKPAGQEPDTASTGVGG